MSRPMKSSKLLQNPRQRENRTGITLPPSVMRSVRKGVAELNRGEGWEFDNGRELIQFLHRRRRPE